MMTQGEHMNVVEMRRAGWSISAIARTLGRDRNTIAKWLEAGGPPPRRAAAEVLVDQRWADRIAELLSASPTLPVTSLHRLLAAEGCPASYQTLTRHVRAVHGPRRIRTGSATAVIETPAGEEAQADWSELSAEQCAWLGIEPPVYCFGCILCWSRQRHWWFADSLDFHHTIEGFVRSFDALSGVPAKVRIDNMGALVTRSHPKLQLRPPATAFVNYYGFTVAGCWPKDAARKGKVERPFRELKESFLAEM
jgi:transposase